MFCYYGSLSEDWILQIAVWSISALKCWAAVNCGEVSEHSCGLTSCFDKQWPTESSCNKNISDAGCSPQWGKEFWHITWRWRTCTAHRADWSHKFEIHSHVNSWMSIFLYKCKCEVSTQKDAHRINICMTTVQDLRTAGILIYMCLFCTDKDTY